MIVAVFAVLGGAVAAGTWMVCRPTFAAPVLQRRNYRGIDVPVGAGVLVVLSGVVVEAMASVVGALGRDVSPDGQAARWIVLVTALGFGLLGLFDDLAAHGDDRGFRGHVTSLVKGRLTTGGIKLVGGGLVAIIAVRAAGADDLLELGIGAALVALAANLGNLFDRAPGRCTKVAIVGALVLLALAGSAGRTQLGGMAVIVGAGCGLLAFDLREELMLGDAGANVLGAVVGLGVVLTSGLVVQAVVLVVVAALNVASERISFSRVIDQTAPLRALDRLGRRPSA